MSNINNIMWLIPAIIAVVAIIKVIYQINKNRNASVYDDGNERTIREAVNSSGKIKATETGSMIYYANDRYGQTDKEYRFNYRKVGDSWRAYILRMPSLGGRDDSGLITHRLFDNGRAYVCWDRPVNSLKDMQIISKAWADNIQEYIATGKRFG